MTLSLRNEVPGLPSSNQVRTTTRTTGTGPTPTRHQNSPPEQNPPGHRKSKEQELSASTALDASPHRLLGPRRESAPPPRPSARVRTASTPPDASQHRLHGPRRESAPPPRPSTRVSSASTALERESAPPPRPSTRVSTSSPPRAQHPITRHGTRRTTGAQHQYTRPGAPARYTGLACRKPSAQRRKPGTAHVPGTRLPLQRARCTAP